MSQDLTGTWIHACDVARFASKRKKQLIRVACLSFVSFYLFFSLKHPEYLVEASFKEASNKTNLSSIQLLQAALVNSSSDNNAKAVSILRSKTFLEKVILKTGLQIEEKKSFFSRLTPCLKKKDRSIEFHTVDSRGEKCLNFALSFDKQTKQFFLHHQNRITPVYEERMIQLEGGSFFFRLKAEEFVDSSYVLIPLETVLQKTVKKLKVKTRRDDPSVIDVSFLHKDPYLGAYFVNCLLDEYKKKLIDETKNISKKQMEYLLQRQQELTLQFDATLEEHKRYLENSLGEKGYFSFSEQREFLEGKRGKEQKKRKKLFAKYAALSTNQGSLSHSFLSDEGKKLEQKLHVFTREKEYFARSSLNQKKEEIFQERRHLLENKLVAYPIPYELKALEKSREGEMKQNPFLDLHGLDLDHLRHLYQKKVEEFSQSLEISKRVDQLASDLHKDSLARIDVSITLSDSQIDPLLKWIADVQMHLFDDRFINEKDKLRAQLFLKEKGETLEKLIQKKQKQMHVDLTALKHRCHELERVIYQQLEKEIHFIEEELLKEKKLFQKQICEELETLDKELFEINSCLAELPKKWVLENKLHLEAELKVATMEGIAKLVESKNLEHHLENILSDTLDKACAAKKPHRFFPFLISVALTVLVTFFWTAQWIFFQIFKGFPISLEGLSSLGYSTFYGDENLCEKLFHFIQKRDSKIITLVLNKESFSMENFLDFILKHQRKIAIIYSLDVLKTHQVFEENFSLNDTLLQLNLSRDPHKETLQFFTQDFEKKFSALSQKYETIFFVTNSCFDSWQTQCFIQRANLSIGFLKEESLKDLSSFKKESTIFVDLSM